MEDPEQTRHFNEARDAIVVRNLLEILQQFQAMEQAPVIGGQEYEADHGKGYLARTKEADDLLDKARHVALVSLPDEIQLIYNRIEDECSRVWRIGKYRE